jgi:hypothetical protein
VNARFLLVRGSNYEGVIVRDRGGWTPSARDIADLEAALQAA